MFIIDWFVYWKNKWVNEWRVCFLKKREVSRRSGSETRKGELIIVWGRANARNVSFISLLRSTERIRVTSFFSPAGFTMSRRYWSRMLDHFRLWPPSWTDWHTWSWSHAGIDPLPDKINLDHLKLLYCEFQKYEVMTMSVVGGQPKKHANPSCKATKHIERTFLISDYLW